MPPLNASLARVRPSPIMEARSWLDGVTFPDGLKLLDVSQAAPYAPPHRTIRERLSQAILTETDAHFYCPVLGNDPLRAEIAAQWSALYEGAVTPDQVGVTAGCNQAFCTALMTACQPGDAVMLPYPWYFNHKMWLDMAGLTCIPVPCDSAMLPDPAAARAAMTDRVRAIVLVTPNNPTGAEYPAPLLEAFFDLARERDALLLVDETYRDFRTGTDVPHTLFQREDWDQTFVHLYSFSKVYRLTGHRTGALITSAARLAEAEKYLDTTTICPGQSGQIAALHGLQTLDQWVAEERDEFAHRRLVLLDLFANRLPGWSVHGAGAYFAWVTPPWDSPAADSAQRLIREAAILCLPGTMFLPDDMTSGALRIAFANTDDAGLTEMTRRLAAISP